MEYNFPQINSGDLYRGRIIRVRDTFGNPIDLSDYTPMMQLRIFPHSASVALDITDYLEVHDALNGLMRINTFIMNVKPRIYHYDLRFFDGTDPFTWMYGKWEVKQSVTRNT